MTRCFFRRGRHRFYSLLASSELDATIFQLNPKERYNAKPRDMLKPRTGVSYHGSVALSNIPGRTSLGASLGAAREEHPVKGELDFLADV